MKSYSFKNVFRCLLIPVSDEPGMYYGYIVVREADGARNVPQQRQKEIIDSITDTKIRSVHLWATMNTGGVQSESLELKWLDARSLLANIGLSWLAEGVHRPELKTLIEHLQAGNKVDLPFVPEFAHDLERADKLLDGDFYGVMPISGEFTPTLNCPFRCIQCSYRIQKIACGLWDMNDKKDTRWHMQLDLVEPLILRIAEAGVRYMVITGGGEPLLNPKVVIKALHTARKYNIDTGLYTNGVFLKKYVSDILRMEPRFVRVSVDAGSSEIYKKYHQPLGNKHDFFVNTKDSVKHLALSRAVGDWATEIGLSYIVNRTNYLDCENFADWVARIVEEVSDKLSGKMPIIDFVRFTPTIDYFSHVQDSQGIFKEAVTLIREKVKPVLQNAGVRVILFKRFEEIAPPKGYTECLGCSWFAEVSPDGAIYTCCEMNFLPGYWIGNLLQNSLPAIWRSNKRKEVMSRINRSQLRSCPVFCKPHNINKVAYRIREMCKDARNKDMIRIWLSDLNELHNWSGDGFFRKQKTVAF